MPANIILSSYSIANKKAWSTVNFIGDGGLEFDDVATIITPVELKMILDTGRVNY